MRKARELTDGPATQRMPLYRVIIHGQNFRLRAEEKWEKFGFYTPRFAEAPDAVLAEQAALEDFRQSAKYLELLESSLNSADDQPIICGEEIVEVAGQENAGKGPAGLVLYRESDE
jgi:hypothetical protein